MSELQMGLLALGGVAVLGVFGYNKWQERQHRKVAERVFQPHGEDVLLGRGNASGWQEPEVRDTREPREPMERLEPALIHDEDEALVPERQIAAPAARAPEPPTFAEPLREAVAEPKSSPALAEPAPWEPELPVVEDGALEDGEANVTDLPETRPEALDVPLPATLLAAGVDAIAVLELVEFISANQLLSSQEAVLARIKKPVLWAGFNETQGAWEFITPQSGQSYRRLRIGLQLANRQGPVSIGDLSLFTTAMQQLADELMAVVDLPSSQQVLDQAQRLDRFCADVDMQIGVNLISRGTSFAGTKIRALAEASGMVLEGHGVYTRFDDEGRALFSIQNLENGAFTPEAMKSLSTHGLIFLLDVPRVPRGQFVYTQMVDIARRFAEALNGSLVDDNRQPLGEPQLAHIRQEYVIKPQAAMEHQGIAAGSPLALRLFA